MLGQLTLGQIPPPTAQRVFHRVCHLQWVLEYLRIPALKFDCLGFFTDAESSVIKHM